jgi:hypothetical protein
VVSDAGEQCSSGGVKIEVGLDDGTPGGTAKNGTLEPQEVDTTKYVCGVVAPVCGEPADGADATQFNASQSWGLSGGYSRFGQVFESDDTGILTGIDTALSLGCNTAVPGAELELTLYEGTYDGTQTPIATASIPMSDVPYCNAPSMLTTTPGSGYFDLSSECVQVKRGRKYTFVLEPKSLDTCSTSSWTCGKTGYNCNVDRDCDTSSYVQFGVGYGYYNNSGYPDGSMLGANFDNGTQKWSTYSYGNEYDMAFVTYINY